MTDRLTIALAQINPMVGDISGNLAKITRARNKAAQYNADLVVFSELVVCGYPIEDLVLKPLFQETLESEVKNFVTMLGTEGPGVVIGVPWRHEGKLYNTALLIDEGRLRIACFKSILPNYGVFDEKRVFCQGLPGAPIDFRDVRLGILICEDMWFPDVTETLHETGSELLIVLNSSPFDIEKQQARLSHAIARITETTLPLIYVNQVGGQDELVFDGTSFVLNDDCTLGAQGPSFQESLILTHWTKTTNHRWHCAKGQRYSPAQGYTALYQAMMLGLRDYVEKNHFPGVLLGLSGGIDSALAATIAVDALGCDRVHPILMPSPYTTQQSLEDARDVAKRLECRLQTITIDAAMETFAQMLQTSFDSKDLGQADRSGVTEENLQSRIRGVILMALSNKFGAMVLATGNKSELSVGYATLYGDMCGGYAILKDVYKTTVYSLAAWRNTVVPPEACGSTGQVIPLRIFDKPPTAELKPHQCDQDTLPPYDRLDDILECLIERDLGMTDIVARGHAATTVKQVGRMLDRAEYKRRQAPPGVKLSPRSFGKERRYPIVNAFRLR